jgi:hypothetical protein
VAARLVGLAASCLVAGGALARPALPEPVAAQLPGLQPVGSGELRWLGRPIYDASLWTTKGRFQGYRAGEPVALSLWYQRSFSERELLRIVDFAWNRLELPDDAPRQRWITELERIWSDVEPGHNLTTVVVPGVETRFYDHDRLLGRIAEPDFGPAFLSIWLDARSPVRGLRAQLLGAAE